MITTVTGNFQKFSIEAETADDAFTKLDNVVFTADVNSISTNNEQRDTHLKSADFFDAATHDQLTFRGKTFEPNGDKTYKLHGDLTIRGTTKPITVDVTYEGIVQDPYGQTKAGFEVDGKISRQEFGLTWNAVTEAGSVVVSDDIRIHCEIQLVKQAS